MILPSEIYFKQIKTEEDYKKFMACGMAYEFEFHCPNSWIEHLEMCEWREKYINVVEEGE